MIEISKLEELVKFKELGTFSKVAEELHTSQPAVTRAMKDLEDELGISLFDRTKNHIELNKTGKFAVDYARKVLDASNDFELKVREYERSLNTISIGFCAPVPQQVLTPIINTMYSGMTLSSTMCDELDFYHKLDTGIYQLIVTSQKPESNEYIYKKCGKECLYICVLPSNPLAFYPSVHLKDLDNTSILMFSDIGFWKRVAGQNMPHTKFLIQIDSESFAELASKSEYPSFSSSYYINQNLLIPGKINIPLADDSCTADYYLVCKKEKFGDYKSLFDAISENTIK